LGSVPHAPATGPLISKRARCSRDDLSSHEHPEEEIWRDMGLLDDLLDDEAEPRQSV